MTWVQQNAAFSGLRENGEVEEDFTASGMAMAMAELDLGRSEKVGQNHPTVNESCNLPVAVMV